MQEAAMKFHLTLAWLFILYKLVTMSLEWNERFQPPRLAVWQHTVLVLAKYTGDGICRIDEVILEEGVVYRRIGRVLCSDLDFQRVHSR